MTSSQLIAVTSSAICVMKQTFSSIPASWAKLHYNNKDCVDMSTEVNSSYSRHNRQSAVVSGFTVERPVMDECSPDVVCHLMWCRDCSSGRWDYKWNPRGTGLRCIQSIKYRRHRHDERPSCLLQSIAVMYVDSMITGSLLSCSTSAISCLISQVYSVSSLGPYTQSSNMLLISLLCEHVVASSWRYECCTNGNAETSL